MTKESKVMEQGSEEDKKENSWSSGGTLPKIDFSTFIYSLYTTAQFQLGEMPNPYTQKYEEDLTMAGETINIITMLEKKTVGNLTKEEEKLVEDLLYNLRMTYVRKIEKLKQGT